MICWIRSSLETFKNLDFHPGLNILLADKSDEATERHTRNRAGKTSLVEIIHFLVGADAHKDSLFKMDELADYAFEMEFDLTEARVVVERRGQASNNVVLKSVGGDTSRWPSVPEPDLLGQRVITNRRWKNEILGPIMFALHKDKTNDEDEPSKFIPTFRSLFAYFARRQPAGGFLSPFRQSEQQRTYDQQVAISYLLGLDWTIPQQWEYVRQREKGLLELKKAAREGTLDLAIGTTGELRTMLALAERRWSALRERVDSFQVLPEYQNLEQEAAELTLRMNRFADGNTIDRELVTELERLLAEEMPPSSEDLVQLYQKVGIIFPDVVLRRFKEVRSFHESVIQNRQSYLSGELNAARRRIAEREEEMRTFDKRRSEIMAILRSHGALDQFLELQAELARRQVEVESLRKRFTAAEQLESLKAKLEIERQELLLRLRQNYQEQDDTLKRAIVAFEESSNALYEDAGSLTIEPSLNGPRFDVKIHGSKSKGISNMQIFCFDMMLMRICAERGLGPGFLVHDSHLFDGVDERQVSRALQVGARTANDFDFQYIVTLNSDQLPQELPEGFNLGDYVLPVRLTDETETGGLFGFRFG